MLAAANASALSSSFAPGLVSARLLISSGASLTMRAFLFRGAGTCRAGLGMSAGGGAYFFSALLISLPGSSSFS